MSKEEKERENLLSELKLLNNILSTLIEGRNRKKQGSSLAGVERDFIDVVLDAAGTLTVVYNREGQIICFNRACEQATGFSSKEVIGKYVWDLSPSEEEAQMVRREFGRLGIGRSANRFETFWARKEGGKRLITWENTVLSENEEKGGYIIGMGIDITARRQLEENLRDSEEKYRKLVETANDAIIIADAETGTILDVNEKAGELLGLPTEQIIGMHQYHLHPREEALQYRAIFEEAVRKGGGNYNDLTVLCSDGRKLPVDISASVVEIGGKKIIQGIFRDIREKERAEREIRESEERLNAFFTGATAGLAIIDSSLKFKKMNQRLADIHGIDVEKHTGKTLQEALPKLSEKIVPLCLRVLEKGESVMNVEISGETPAFPAISRHFIASAFPVPGPLRKPSEVGWVVVENAELKNMEDILRVQKLESLGLLTEGIARDFNILLTAILSRAELTRLHSYSPARVLKSLSDVEKISLRARGITQQLLTFSKVAKPVRKPVFIESIVRESVKCTLSGSKVTSEMFVPDDLRGVDADPALIGQAINNILINAKQALPAGGKVLILLKNTSIMPGEVSLLREGKYVCISIQDGGAGIAREHRAKVFDPYFTTKEGASGLGLSTCHSIVLGHEGHIVFETGEGRGTTFHVYLPASEKKPEKVEKREEFQERGEGTDPRSPRNQP